MDTPYEEFMRLGRLQLKIVAESLFGEHVKKEDGKEDIIRVTPYVEKGVDVTTHSCPSYDRIKSAYVKKIKRTKLREKITFIPPKIEIDNDDSVTNVIHCPSTERLKKIKTNWCYVCGIRSFRQLLECECCPAVFHEECAIRHKMETYRLRVMSTDKPEMTMCPHCSYTQVSPGSIVWVKTKKIPWWPAKVLPVKLKRRKFNRSLLSRCVRVQLLERKNGFIWVDKKCIMRYEPDHINTNFKNKARSHAIRKARSLLIMDFFN